MHSEDEVRRIVEDLQRRGLAEEVYRALWFGHVLEDVESYMTEEKGYEGPPLTSEGKSIATTAASRYVYENACDCSIPYWDNIDNLIEDLEKDKEM